jgi:hypothetical protein
MTRIADVTASTVTVLVPIAIRRRNGRPKIVLPDDGSRQPDASDPVSGGVLRAIARAWDWRRRLEAREVSTLQDLADAEKVTLPFVSRFIRLAYLSPMVVERIVSKGEGIAVSLDRLAAAALEPWARQPILIFDVARLDEMRRVPTPRDPRRPSAIGSKEPP